MIVPLPSRRQTRGTVCVMEHAEGGFEVGHESESGNSWGYFSGPYATAGEAIAAAQALNRDVLNGQCAMFICDSARGGS